MTTQPSTKRQRKDDGVDADPREALFPMTAALLQEKSKLEEALLSVELMDEHGNVLWKCNDLRDGYRQKLKANYDTPMDEEDDKRVWRKQVWTLPVQKTRVFGRDTTELVVTNTNLVKQIKIGVNQYRVEIGCDIGHDFGYDECSQMLRVTMPMTSEMHDHAYATDWKAVSGVDALGENGFYLQGMCTITDAQMRGDLAENIEEQGRHSMGYGYDILRLHTPENQALPGDHDELRVEYVHLAIAGTVRNTLQLFHLVDSSEEEEKLVCCSPSSCLGMEICVNHSGGESAKKTGKCETLGCMCEQ